MAFDSHIKDNQTAEAPTLHFHPFIDGAKPIVMAAADTPTSAPAGPQEISNPNDPRSIIHNDMSEVYARVEAAQNDDQKKVSFEYGKDLRELGLLSMMSGNPKMSDATHYQEFARECLRTGAQVMFEAKDKPENGDAVITDAFIDYGRNLLRPVPHESTAQKQKDAVEAEKILGSAFARAHKEPLITADDLAAHKPGRTPQELAGVLQLLTESQLKVASGMDINSEDGKKAYRAKMQDVIDGMNVGLDIVKNESSSTDNAQKANMLSMLAFAQDRQDLETDRNPLERFSSWAWSLKDEPDAMKTYKNAIKTWQAFDPNDASVPESQRDQASRMQDRELLNTLKRYHEYATRLGYDAEVKDSQNFINKIYDVHAEWKPGVAPQRK